MRRSAPALALVAGCTGAPRTTTPSGAAPGPATEPIASSAGPPAPWPAATLAAAPALRTRTRPLPHDLAQLRGLRGVTISPDAARVAYVVRSRSDATIAGEARQAAATAKQPAASARQSGV